MSSDSARAQPSPGDTVLSTRFSTQRHPRFQVRTDLCVDSLGRRYMRKRALTEAARPHVAAMVASRARLAALYEGTSFDVNRCEAIPDGVAFDFVEGATLADLAAKLLRDGDRGGFVALLRSFFAAATAVAKQPFQPTSAFHAVFGALRLPAGMPATAVTDLDLILPNIIVHDERWQIIDYEWTFDFPVPVGFVLYRTLHYLCLDAHAAPYLDKAIRGELVRVAGIGPALRAFRRMELALQLYVSPAEDLLRIATPGSRSALRWIVAHLPRAYARRMLDLRMLASRTP
ncbi:MAG: hypothetical protein PHR35_08530 [Kiritimatiellae bacterium]|nr:hypothetical protein [Kiritimatiellia bacterium]